MKTKSLILLMLTLFIGYLIAQEPEPQKEYVVEEIEEIEHVAEEVIEMQIMFNQQQVLQQQGLDHISNCLYEGEIINMLAAWSTFLKDPENKEVDIDTAIQYIIQRVEEQRTVLFEPGKDITTKEFRAKINGEISRIKPLISGFEKVKENPKDYVGGAISIEATDFDKLKQKRLEYIWLLEQLKKQLASDDAQLVTLNLQNILQKQQEMMEMMSQITKMLHDTAMAVIRNIGG